MDTIGNMLTTIKNAISVKKKKIVIPASNFKKDILNILKNHKYINEFKLNNKNKKTSFTITLRYDNNKPAISYIRKISKPGLRVYTTSKKIPRSLGGFGTIIISTPKGVLDGRTAKSQKVGGELICEIY